MGNDQLSWSILHTFTDIQSAYIIKGALDAEGIPACIAGETISSVYPTTLSWGGIDLYVPEENMAEAKKVLAHNGIG